MNRSSQRRSSVLIAWMLLFAFVPSTYLAATADPAAAGPDDFTLDKTGPADALIGEVVTYTLTAQGSQTNPLFNISFRDVLPPGVSYVDGSGDPAPTLILADEPSAGYTTLVWENVSDLPPNSTSSVSYDVDTDPDTNPATLPVGSTFTNTASAVGNADAFTLPDIDPDTGEFTGDFTGEASDSMSTEVIAYRLTKTATSTEILRGVHENGMGTVSGGSVGTIYTLEVEGNPNYPNTAFTVTDVLPPQLEFLGCDNYYNTGDDYSTDVPLNGDAALDEEWPGSGPVYTPPNTGNCATPESVSTNADGSTAVAWSFATLPASGTVFIDYGAGIPLRANCATFTGATPTAASLEQGRNLDNNCGAPTGEEDIAPWPNPALPELLTTNEQLLMNAAETCGTYGFATAGAYDGCQQDELNATAEDLRLNKSAAGTLSHGETITFNLTANASEYRDFTDLVFRDLLPDGLCYTGSFLADLNLASDWSTEDCAGAGTTVPTISVDGGAAVNAPASSVEELADGRTVLVWDHADHPILNSLSSDSSVTLSFEAIVRTAYREDFDAVGAVLAGDAITNTAEVSGPDFITSENTNTEGIDPEDDTASSPEGDTASAGLDTPLPSIRKFVSVKDPGPLDENTSPDPFSGADCANEYANITWEDSAAGGPNELTDVYVTGYGPGDIVCFALTAEFPAGLSYAGVEITDLLPPGYTYVPSSAAAIGVSTTSVNPAQTIAAHDLTGSVSVTESDRRVVFDLGGVDNAGRQFTYVIAAILGPPGANPPGDISFNQQKMVTENTAGDVFQFRDMAGVVWEEPIVQIAKGIDSVTSVSDDVDVTGPQGIDFDNSYGDDDPDGQLVENDAVVDYRIDIWNEGNRDAANVEVWDDLPNGITCADVSAITPAGTCDGSTNTIKWPGNLAVPENYPDVSYRPGVADVTTYTYSVTVPATVDPGVVYLNEAGVRSYSVDTNTDNSSDFIYYPADNIDPAIDPDDPLAIQPNTVSADDQAEIFTENIGVTKEQWSGIDEAGNGSNGALAASADQATIGEIVQYAINVTIPEGTTVYDGVITDDIPTGMTYFEGSGLFDGSVSNLTPSVSLVAAGSGGVTENANACGSEPSIADFDHPVVDTNGTVTVTLPCDYENAAGSGDDIVRVTFYVQVDVDGANTADPITTLANQANFSWDESDATFGGSVNSNTVNTTVVEPAPVIDKVHTVPAASNVIIPGGNATWQLTVTNPDGTNTSTLHDIVVVDSLPDWATPLDAPGGSPVETTNDTVEGPGGAIGVWNETLRTITWNVDVDWNPVAATHALTSLDPDGAAIVIDFDVEFDAFLPTGTIITNNASVQGDSLAITDPSNDDSDQDARPYTDTDTDDLEVVQPSVTKDLAPFGDPDVDDTVFTVGEPVQYAVSFSIPEGTVAFDATLFDTLPTGIAFDEFGNDLLGADPIVGANCFQGDTLSTTGPLTAADIVTINPTGGNAQLVSWYLGDTVASGGSCDITVPYTVHVDDNAVDTDTLTNSAQSAWNSTDDVDDTTVITDLPADSNEPSEFDTESTPATETISIVEPQLELDKDVAELPGLTAVGTCDTTAGNDTASSNDADGTQGAAAFGTTNGDGCDLESEDSVRYTLTIDNSGTSPAHDITVVDTVPVGVNPFAVGGVEASATETLIPSSTGATGLWNNSLRTITWTFVGPVAVAGSISVDYDAQLSASDDLLDEEDLTNIADIPEYFGLSETERNTIVADNPANDDIITYGNGPTADTDRGAVDPDEVTVEVHFPELTITKGAATGFDPTDVRIDEPFIWEITIENSDGVASAYNIDAEDTLPPGWTYVQNSATVSVAGGAASAVEPTCTADAGVCNDPDSLNSETLNWTDLNSGLGEPLAPGETIVIRITAIPEIEVLDDPAFLGSGNSHTNSVSTVGEDQSGSDGCCGGTDYGDDTTHEVNIQSFDLALRKTLVPTTDPVRVGTEFTFAIEVFNQGTVDAFDVEITDYVQSEWGFDAALNTAALTGNDNDWDGTDLAKPTVVIPTIAAGTSEVVEIVLTLESQPDPDEQIHNLAEISSADDDTNPNNTGPDDIDSTEDDTNDEWDPADPANDATSDNEIDNGSGDEDDHDIASFPSFDLALLKTVDSITPSPVVIGSVIRFDIEVINQGSIDATDVVITDYIQSGFAYDSAANTAALIGNANDWGGTATLATLDVGDIAAGDSVTVSIELEVVSGAAPLENHAEISEADDDGDPLTTPPVDIDSDPDQTNDDIVVDDVVNETGVDATGVTGDDEDDHDVALIPVFDLALDKQLAGIFPPGPLRHGSIVTFEIEVYNQGSVDATDVIISDYIQAGWTFDPAANTGVLVGNTNDWDGTDLANPTLLVGDITAGSSTVVFIALEFTSSPLTGTLDNTAEIASADDDGDPLTTAPTDIDSTPDRSDDDDVEDDEINENGQDDTTLDGIADQDDHDIHSFDFFDLALRKTVGTVDPSPVVIGSAVTFQIEVFNQGSIDATDITITDFVQPGFTFDAADNTAALTGNDNDWDGTDPVNPTLVVPALAAGDSVVVDIVLDVTDDEEFLTNTAEISDYDDDGDPLTTPPVDVDSTPDATDGDPVDDDSILNENGDEDDHDVATLSTFDLALRKTIVSADPAPARVGSVVTFEIEVFNQGSINALDVIVTDYVQPGFTFDPALNTAAVTGNTNDWLGTDPTNPTIELDALAVGTSTTLEINLTIVGGAAPLDNLAEITSADDDGDPLTTAPTDIDSTPDADPDDDTNVDDEIDNAGGDEDDHDGTTMPVFDLALRKTVFDITPTPAIDGTLVTFEIEVFNQGSIDATDVIISDYIQAGFAYDDANNTAALTGNAADWDGTDPANPALFVGAIAAGTSETVRIILEIPVVPTTPTTFENHAEIASYDDDADPLTDPPADIDSIQDRVDDDAVEDNEIGENGLTDTTGDGTADEDDHDVALVPMPLFDLALTKTLGADQDRVVDVGDDVTFTLTVTNQGDIDATNVVLTDYLPESIELSSSDSNGWTDNGDGTATTTIAGPIAPGGTATIDIVVEVLEGFAGDQINVAEISEASDINGTPRADVDSVPDANNTNDTGGDPVDDDDVIDNTDGDEDDHDPEVFRIREIDLTIDKRFVEGTQFGSNAVWEIDVTNNGPDTAEGPFTVVDDLPGTLVFSSAAGDGWTCSVDGRRITCVSEASLANGATSTPIRIETRIIGEVGTQITNGASVSTPTVETSQINNDDTTAFTVSVQSTTPLAFTGAATRSMALAALLLLGLGIVMVGASRRREAEIVVED